MVKREWSQCAHNDKTRLCTDTAVHEVGTITYPLDGAILFELSPKFGL